MINYPILIYCAVVGQCNRAFLEEPLDVEKKRKERNYGSKCFTETNRKLLFKVKKAL